MTRADDRNFATWADGGGTAPNREPWLSDGRCMNFGPGNVMWVAEPDYSAVFGPPLPSIGAVVRYLNKRAEQFDEGTPEANAYELAADHVEALEEQYADRFAPAVAALDELKLLKRHIEGIGPGDKEGTRPTARSMTDHEHNWDYVSPGRRKCYGCGARLAVEVQFHEAPHSTTLSAPTLRGSDVEWAQQFRPDRKGQSDG